MRGRTLSARERQAVQVLRSPELCKLAGISYRQLDTWVRNGYLKETATGYGTLRYFTPDQIELATVMADLVRFGITPSRASTYAHELIASGRIVTGSLSLTRDKGETDEPTQPVHR